MAHKIDTHSHSDAEVATKPSLDAKTSPVFDTEAIDHGPDPNAQSGSKWRRIAGFFWDSIDGDPKYRAYVRRLDLIFFPTVLLGYFIKYLDQTNYSNAFVSGMQEDLELYGNERNWLGTWFSLGIMVGTIPAQMLQLSHIRPSILIPTCEICWSALVIGMGFTHSIKVMYALRFFIGLFESCAFPGYIAMLGSWYGPNELTKRLAILLEVESIASMFSGYLQAGLYSSMNGRHGLAGWRWLFIMDGVISVPVAIWGLFGLPDHPHNTRAFYWTKEHIKYGQERIAKFGVREQVKLNWAEIKRIYLGWRIWMFVIPYTMVAACHTATSYFNLWLKEEGYSVQKINYLPTGGNALAIVITVAWGMIADRTKQYYWLIASLALLMIVANILLSVWDIPKSALMFAYYISYAGSACTPVLISWTYGLNAADTNTRQLLVATANLVSHVWVLWVPLVLFPTYDAPKYKYGYQILILFGGIAILSITAMKYLYSRKKESRGLEKWWTFLLNDEKVPLSEGYIPLLVNLTVEDKAAKGLRKHKGGTTREDAVYVSALEAVRDNRHELARKLNLDTDHGSGNAASRPAIFTLSLAAGHVGDTSESALDAWLGFLSPGTRQDFLQGALDEWKYQRNSQRKALEKTTLKWPFVLCTAVQELLVAAQLQTAPFQEILYIFDQDAKSAMPIVRSLLNRFAKGDKQERFICGLLNRHEYDLDEEKAQYAALVASEFIDPNNTPLVTQAISRLLKVVKIGTLPLFYRVMAGRYLSLFGDPRDLVELVEITEGTSFFGSFNHPNSRPVHRLHIGSFKIGAFPVLNRDYGEFVQQTGRIWLSQDGYDPFSRNTPATDVTWHDARAFCQWVTQKWRKTGKISLNEIVQLPSEPQWERASRGDQRESQAGQDIYPRGTNFATSLSNCEELALNNKCAVGLFPQSRSPFGCYDMTGQVWEWCKTLWGEDMATPTFIYPWTSSDGREDLEADGSIRRVLRGGCFSSGQAKATCTYRGSLEPTGFWRGNGFRIAVVSE
ncbi:transporter [Fusarium acutatum]|uniref:Transporter n=1 Tax=Fusarium acutatum TaxID=78861 RepID=A0A8H4JPF5_9HYPO|nr:transporter [Fusarium acutatum]